METRTCPSGHTLPVNDFHSYVKLDEGLTGEEAVTFTCPGGKRGHSFSLAKAVKRGMFTADEAVKIAAAAWKMREGLHE